MKCDELTIYDGQWCDKSEVDEAIAELKAENRRLRRALWLARAKRASEKQQLFLFSYGFEKLCIDGFFDPYNGRKELSPKKWVKVFNKVENKCLKKAENY